VPLVGTLAFAARAQEARSPYGGQERRAIKALAPYEIEGCLEGKGMGLAKAAELNHYPGPMHVLEMAEDLKLTPEQRAQTQRFYDEMHRQAVALGKRIVERERALDRLFAKQKVTEPVLRAHVVETGKMQGQLRFAHLCAHLRMRSILTPRQIERYDDLRGYGR
jgi:Spy/CpxP family protein refolding chaperone